MAGGYRWLTTSRAKSAVVLNPEDVAEVKGQVRKNSGWNFVRVEWAVRADQHAVLKLDGPHLTGRDVSPNTDTPALPQRAARLREARHTVSRFLAPT